MSNLMIHTHIKLQSYSRAMSAGLAGVVDRVRREDGQDLVEYGGLLILIAAIIAALFAAGILGDFNSVVKPDVSKIFNTPAS
jgi:Flp pilus assembly pilin Flp